MKNKTALLKDIIGFLTGSIFNIVLTIAVVALTINYAQQYFEVGKDIVSIEAGSKTSKLVNVSIQEGLDALQIGEILEDKGLIENKYYFYLQARLNNTYKYMKNGDYTLNTNMNMMEIMEILQAAPVVEVASDVKIMIPEGYNIKQIAELCASKELFSTDDFLEACTSKDYNFDFLDDIKDNENYLEGYLFPDTYFLSSEPTPDELISKMLSRFDDIYDSTLKVRTEELGLTIQEVVTMASIVEKEIKVGEERPLASAVIYNRLNIDMKLQMCSTVMYVLDKSKDRLLESDLQIESPYNTYINSGLPAGPIASPGKASIEAVLNPADKDYLYFVVSDEEAGTHYFTDDYDAFLTAKAKYNQKF